LHRRQLLDQWVGALAKFLNIAPTEIGRIGGGKHAPTGRIDVAMIQSLCRNGVVDDLVGNYGYVIVDECHHVSAVSFEQVVRRCKARYVTGLSATVARKDGHQPIVFMQCGPVRYKVSDLAQAAKRPFDHKVVVRPTSFRLPPHLQNAESTGIQDIYTALVQDDRRNRLIVDDVMAAVQAGRSPVVLTERREHLDLLVNLLAERSENVLAFTGGMGKKQRRKLADQLAGIPPDQPRVLVATGRYLGEGFDDERLDTLFLALPIAWRGTLSQYAGRLHRANATKQHVIVYDYVDFEVPALANMYKKRRRGYAAIGYEIVMPEKEHRPVQLTLEGR
jgi:superfamily II DNA or RNA helicase